ncbi:hypothetical protein LTR36_009693 [Oleoguttula mirabilis]|uniref:Peptidase S33 tripeptidyl aminopeptidase-like C-terminal domain-containing protein n=1 Tax=Oleoguttula mirabilis TaxID=1507867 RepID=A0AAV9J691_9PEZI|nr:hypothetical protein LTR36_009693 [Oleoguttula mirabilis]
MMLLSFTSLLISTCYGLVPDAYLPKRAPPDIPWFDWHRIQPSQALAYHDCYNGFQCARLTLPLDWHNSSNPNNISLAVIRLPATVPADDPSHGGSIIINPGGPGGPGTLYALGVARDLQRLLDGEKHYEIVSFDPRGVFMSTPSAYCFDNFVEAEIWWREKRAAGNLDSSEAALRYHWAMEEARGELCASTGSGAFGNGDNVRNHLSTAYVARDMLELVYKLEENKRGETGGERPLDVQQAMTAQGMPDHSAQLQYIGGSYGTFIGQTFAAMYPEHVGRMILDSNLDADNWVSLYEASVDDHEAIRDYFFKRCFAGGTKCALWRPEDRSPQDVRTRYDVVYASVKENPAVVSGQGHAKVVTSDELQWAFLMASYQPLRLFNVFAEMLNELYTGGHTALPFWQHVLPTGNTFYDEVLEYLIRGADVTTAIHCSDGPDLSGSGNLTGYQSYLANLTSGFPNAGALQAEFKLPCWSWPDNLRTKWRFDGPFNASVPILFVNNRLDTATPLKNAMKMAEQFEGSAVLVQDNVGHGALWPAGQCVWDWVKSYLDDGTLPPSGTVCGFPCEAFGGDCGDGLVTEALVRF